ncbi:hypothetical protein [Streptomyces sp. NPDC088925]|uniref:hypothetical protein n=1 Tax=Streptomyces sp. NPDC088925 TaxID=3365914 RepID=UPI0038065354
MNLDVADPATRTIRVCDDRCPTCPFRPGNVTGLRPGRLAHLLNEILAVQGHLVCHVTLNTPTPAVCKGFAQNRAALDRSLVLRLLALGVLNERTHTPVAEEHC